VRGAVRPSPRWGRRRAGDIGERGLVERCGGELFDRGEHDGVLELGEVAFEDGADERGAHLGSAEDLAVLGFVFGAGPGASGLMVAVPPGLSFTVVKPRCSARVAYSPLGSAMPIHRPSVAGAVDGGLAPQEALHERGLAVAGFAEHPAVRVGDEPSGVGLEGVPAELAASGEEVETDVGASVSEGALDRERVDARHVGGGALVVAEPQRWPGHDARRVEGARPSGQRAAQAEVLAGVEDAQVHAGLAGELLDDLGVLVEVVEAAGRDGDEPGVAHLGVAGDELLLPVEQRLGGTPVAGVDAPTLLLLGDGVGLELHEVSFDASPALVGGDRLEVDGHRPGDAAAGQERFQPCRWHREAGPGADPPGAVERSVDAEVSPVRFERRAARRFRLGRARGVRRDVLAGTGPGRQGRCGNGSRRCRPRSGSSGSDALRSAERRPRRSASTEVTSARRSCSSAPPMPGAVARETFAGDGDGDDGLVVDGGRGADLEQVAVRRRAPVRWGCRSRRSRARRCGRPSRTVGRGRTTTGGRRRHVRPRTGRAGRPIRRGVVPARRVVRPRTAALTPGTTAVRVWRCRSRIAPSRRPAAPVDVDDVEPVEARGHRRRVVGRGPQRERGVPASTASQPRPGPARRAGAATPRWRGRRCG
jgi:hypothetical protein